VHAFLVTGVCGAGKSTLARQLRDWGNEALSADADTALCGWADAWGRRVARPACPDAAWLSAHRWVWDPDRLDEIITEARRADAVSLWLCGWAANAVDLADRFDAVFLLEIDQPTMVARLGQPGRGNDFGRVGDSLHAALAEYLPLVAAWRRRGAICIDATRDLVTVAEDLLMGAAMAVLRQ
jgi:hypothetical protein